MMVTANPLAKVKQRTLHLYRLTVAGCDIIFVIAIDPISSAPGLYNFMLFSKAGQIERRLCVPAQLKLAFDPEDAEFDVCLTPKEHSSPPQSHYSLRIWIRRSSSSSAASTSTGPLKPIYRHRLFSDEDFYIARFPLDVYGSTSLSLSIPSVSSSTQARTQTPPPQPSRTPPLGPRANANVARNRYSTAPPLPLGVGGVHGQGQAYNNRSSRIPPSPTVLATPEEISDYEHVLGAKVSGVSLRYTVTLTPANPNGDSSEYLISLEYEAGGITRYLVRNIDLRITCPLSSLGFTVYTHFQRHTSTGTMHYLAFWICSPQKSQSQSSQTQTQKSAEYYDDDAYSMYAHPSDETAHADQYESTSSLLGRHRPSGSVTPPSIYHPSVQPHSHSSQPPPRQQQHPEGICQRLWKTDTFLITSPVLALPAPQRPGDGQGLARSNTVMSLPGGVEGMVVAARDGRSPVIVDLAAPPSTAAGPSGSTSSSSGPSSTGAGPGGKEKDKLRMDPWDRKKLEAREEWETQQWAEYEYGYDGALPADSELPTYPGSGNGNGTGHSGAFATEDGGAGAEYGRRV